MAAQRAAGRRELVVRADEAVIAIPDTVDGEEVTRFFVSEEDAGAETTEDGRAGALALAGAWSHLDWDEALDELDRIRHESVPTPPIDLDDLSEERCP